MLFNVPAIAGFPKKGTNVSIRVKQTKKQSVLLNIPFILIKRDIPELTICYIH